MADDVVRDLSYDYGALKPYISGQPRRARSRGDEPGALR
jgi:hypothetical protein